MLGRQAVVHANAPDGAQQAGHACIPPGAASRPVTLGERPIQLTIKNAWKGVPGHTSARADTRWSRRINQHARD
jgi:hypothetical protein